MLRALAWPSGASTSDAFGVLLSFPRARSLRDRYVGTLGKGDRHDARLRSETAVVVQVSARLVEVRARRHDRPAVGIALFPVLKLARDDDGVIAARMRMGREGHTGIDLAELKGRNILIDTAIQERDGHAGEQLLVLHRVGCGSFKLRAGNGSAAAESSLGRSPPAAG